MNPTAFAQVKMSGSGRFQPPASTQLTLDSQPGQRVSWTDGGQQNTGVLCRWEEHVAIIDCGGGKEKAVSMDQPE